MCHIFSADAQPATRWRDPYDQQWYRCNPRRQRRCHLCRRRRWAKSLLVQVYYDTIRVYCADTTACQHAQRVGSKKSEGGP